MKKIILIMSAFLICSCASSVTLQFSPEQPRHEKCPKPGAEEISAIKKIAIIPFENSTYRKHEYINPIGSNTVSSKNMSNNMDLYDFKNDDGEIASNLAEKELMNMGGYKLIERKRLNKIIAEHSLNLSGIIDDSEAVQMGKISGIDAILCGSVQKAYEKKEHAENSYGDAIYVGIAAASIKYSLISTKDGSIIWSCIFERNSLNYIDSTITISNRQILNGRKIPLMGLDQLLEKVTSEALNSIAKQ